MDLVVKRMHFSGALCCQPHCCSIGVKYCLKMPTGDQNNARPHFAPQANL
jgi:hypothetical protein